MTILSSDAFTGTTGADIVSRTPTDGGANWSYPSGGTSFLINGGTTAQPYLNPASLPLVAIKGDVLSTTNTIVRATLYFGAFDSNVPQLYARSDSSGANCYVGVVDAAANTARIGKRVAGTLTLLGSGAVSLSMSTAITYAFALTVNGTSISIEKDGTTIQTVTDSSITTGSYAGVGWGVSSGSGGTQSALLDSYSVSDVTSAVAALVVTTQPTTTASGNPISPSVVVKATTDGVTVDTAATGACVGTLPGGAMYGTTTLNFTAGVATFSTLVPGGAARTDALHFASTGFTAVDSVTFPITSGSGSTIRTYEERIVRPIKVAEATASRRRIALRLVDTANAATAVSMTGRKAQLSSAGGAETASTADITQVGTTSRGYVELSLAEATALTAGDYVEARVVAATGLAEYVGCADVFPDDPYAAALTSTSIANATVEAEITALKTYARGTNTSYAITGPTSGVNSRTITTDGSYLPFKSA